VANPVVVDLVTRDRNWSRGFKNAQRDATNFERGMKQVQNRVAGYFAATAVITGVKRSIDAASDLNEAVNKTGLAFGSNAVEVQRWAQGSAKNMGLSRQAALENASTFGLLFSKIGITTDQGTKMSKAMVQLAVDLGSVHNADPTAVLEAQAAAFRGEYDALQRFVPAISAAVVEQEALAATHKRSVKDLTAAEKAQAVYAIMLKQTTKEQGDFARTSGEAANQQKTLAAESRDAQAQLGQQLLPTYVALQKAAIGAVRWFSRLNEETGGMAAKAGLAGVAITGLAIVVAKIVTTLAEARAAWVGYRAAKLAQIPVNAAVAGSEAGLAGATVASGNAAVLAGGKWLKVGLAALAAVQGYRLLTTESKKLEETTRSTTTAVERYGFFAGQALTARQNDAAAATKGLSAEAAALAAAERQQATAAFELEHQTSTLSTTVQTTTDRLATHNTQLAAWRTKVKEAREALQDAIPVFEGYSTKSDLTAAAIVRNLRDEVAAYGTWAADVQTLLRRGADPKFIQALSEKGPQYVHAMATGSNTQLQLAQGYFRDRTAEMSRLAQANLAAAGTKAPRKFADAFTRQQAVVHRAFGGLSAGLQRQVAVANGLASVGGTRVGRSVAGGLAGGIGGRRGDIAAAVRRTASFIIRNLEARLGISSPSRVAMRIGEQFTEGFVLGLARNERFVARYADRMRATLTGISPGAGRTLMRGGLSPAEAWIIARESGGNVFADNPTSTAFGLGQLLLANRQHYGRILGVSPDTTNYAAQLQMFRMYVRDRYGTAERAKAFWQVHGWYGQGGIFTKPTIIGVGERGPEAVVPLGRGMAPATVEYHAHIHAGTIMGGNRDKIARELATAMESAFMELSRRRGARLGFERYHRRG
jgi:hypothetical protein